MKWNDSHSLKNKRKSFSKDRRQRMEFLVVERNPVKRDLKIRNSKPRQSLPTLSRDFSHNLSNCDIFLISYTLSEKMKTNRYSKLDSNRTDNFTFCWLISRIRYVSYFDSCGVVMKMIYNSTGSIIQFYISFSTSIRVEKLRFMVFFDTSIKNSSDHRVSHQTQKQSWYEKITEIKSNSMNVELVIDLVLFYMWVGIAALRWKEMIQQLIDEISEMQIFSWKSFRWMWHHVNSHQRFIDWSHWYYIKIDSDAETMCNMIM